MKRYALDGSIEGHRDSLGTDQAADQAADQAQISEPKNDCRILRISCMSFYSSVTLFAWTAQSTDISNSFTKNASAASCKASIVDDY
jgi:hypothetical protein